MGWWHSYYASVVARSSVGTWLCLLVDNELTGASVLYYIPSTEPLVGVLYYIVIREDYEGLGLGKVLLASSEEILEARGCQVFVASTTSDNIRSRRLFRSMGYAEVEIDDLLSFGRYRDVELVIKALCGFEDDVLLIKGASAAELIAIVKRSAQAVRSLWRSLCYEPWRRLWMK